MQLESVSHRYSSQVDGLCYGPTVNHQQVVAYAKHGCWNGVVAIVELIIAIPCRISIQRTDSRAIHKDV